MCGTNCDSLDIHYSHWAYCLSFYGLKNRGRYKVIKLSYEQEIVPVKIQQTAYLDVYTELDLLALSGATAIMAAQRCTEVVANGKDL